MTTSQMVKAIAKHTGYPEKVVRHILDVQTELFRGLLLREQEVLMSTLLKITPVRRVIEVAVKKGKPDRVKVERILLQVKPVKAFRKELSS